MRPMTAAVARKAPGALAGELLHLGDEGARVALVEPARHVAHALGGLLGEVAGDALLVGAAGHARQLLAQGPEALGHPGLLLGALVHQLAAGLLPQLLGLLAGLLGDVLGLVLADLRDVLGAVLGLLAGGAGLVLGDLLGVGGALLPERRAAGAVQLSVP